MIGCNVSQEKPVGKKFKKMFEVIGWWLVGLPLFLGWGCLFLGSIGLLVFQCSRWLKSEVWTEIPFMSLLPAHVESHNLIKTWSGVEILQTEAWLVLSVSSLVIYYIVHFLYRRLSDWWMQY